MTVMWDRQKQASYLGEAQLFLVLRSEKFSHNIVSVEWWVYSVLHNVPAIDSPELPGITLH